MNVEMTGAGGRALGNVKIERERGLLERGQERAVTLFWGLGSVAGKIETGEKEQALTMAGLWQESSILKVWNRT